MPSEDKKKEDIINRYDTYASQQNNEQWLQEGGSARVPEKPSALYFVGRKVAVARALCGIGITRASRALEIGCSFGQMTSLLAQDFDSLTAVDIAPATLELAEKRLKRYAITNVTFVLDDAEKLDKLPDAAFDVIFSFSTIRYCPDPNQAVKAMYKKLRSGGVAIVDFPNKYCAWHMIIKNMLGMKKHVHDNLYTKRKVEMLFAGSGFKVEKVRHFLFSPRLLPTQLLPVFKAVDFVLEKIPLVRRLAGIIIVKGVKE
jgi:ubiquinone/menaquinone biosynthesis C-methylase UbiE